MQLDDVHGCHSKTCTIHHAPNAAFQPNVIQVILAGCYIPACGIGCFTSPHCCMYVVDAFQQGEVSVIKPSFFLANYVLCTSL